MGSVLNWIQNGKPKLIAYASKRSGKKLFPYRVITMWFSYKYSQFFSLTKKNRF